ncbi:unnamed protein product [Rhizoctonia solani]|uniref:Uncharacterized protein n=1 Tax=Rhizoctonia solani TaxID=456999 RepID=A0A8H3GGX9_9AGAM|nr:unnamed protein product [Rhizoctonia solani]CAE6474649.1 unnamed protein product [Rhizoctonia solani]
MEAPQNERNNAFDPPFSLFVRQLRDAAGFISVRRLKMIVHILTVYLAFSALPNAIPESFPKVLCKLPVLSGYFPYCVREHGRPTEPVIDLDCVAISRLQFRLVHVQEDSARIAVIGNDIKCSAMALRDLIVQVKLKGKDPLGRELEIFVKDGKGVSESLARFNSRIRGLTDRIVSLNEHVLLALEKMLPEPPWGFGDIISFLLSVGRVTPTSRQKTVEDLWLQAISLLGDNLGALIHETQDKVFLFQRLEERLHNIQDMVTAEEYQHRREEQTLKQQWFSNEKKQKSHDTTLQLLPTVLNVRKRALVQILEALLKLKQMSDNLDYMREEAATPTRAVCSIKVSLY